MSNEKWTRVCFVGDDYIDVAEDFDEVVGLMNNGSNFIVVSSIMGGSVYIKKINISLFYSHGVEYLKNMWDHCHNLDELKKEHEPKEWETP